MLKPEAWQPPSPEASALQSLISRQDAVAEDLRREMNRREKAETVSTPPLVLQSIDSSVSFHKAELKRLQQDMAAVTAIRHNPHVRELYTRLLERGKSKMSALCAAPCASSFISASAY